MFELIQSKLAIRQASYAVAVVTLVASLISLFEITQLYLDERRQLTNTLSQQMKMASGAASRAAFHVDEIQAETTLQGLFQFENLQWARISTDLDKILAEKSRPVRTAFTDPLTRFLFGDLVYAQLNLDMEQVKVAGISAASENKSFKKVGLIEIRASPELAGERFLYGTVTLVAALLFQFILLGLVLAIVFHRTLTLPLQSYADAISKLVSTQNRLPRLATPAGHERDEFGMVVARTNQFLEHIESQHQELLHREKVATLGTLLAGVSHELNNPLSILAVQSELLVETTQDPKTRERGRKILAMTNRCAAIVQRFLALARRRDVKKEPSDLRIILREILEILDYQLTQSGIEIDVNISQNIPPILADKSQMTQTILNLIVNAQHAVAENEGDRHIAIDAKFLKKVSSVQISVADNGPGVPAELLEHIFEPFYTTKREGKGTGLGLSYALDVTRSHNGDLTTAVSSLGGAVFTLTIPALFEDHNGAAN